MSLLEQAANNEQLVPSQLIVQLIKIIIKKKLWSIYVADANSQTAGLSFIHKMLHF